MRSKKNKFRNGRVAEIVRLDVHGWTGNLIHRIKGKTTEKEKGVAMVDKIEDLFNLSREDKDYIRGKIREKDIESMKPTKYPKGTEPTKWTRDERGNIVSPFRNTEFKK